MIVTVTPRGTSTYGRSECHPNTPTVFLRPPYSCQNVARASISGIGTKYNVCERSCMYINVHYIKH